MLASEVTHPNVTLAVHRDEATGHALIGVVIDDAFVPFFDTKLSLFDDLHRVGLAQAQQQQQQQSAAEPQQPQQ